MEDYDFNHITGSIIDAAMQIHTALGPGLLEKAYEECLAYKLIQRGHRVEKQKIVPVVFEEVHLDAGFRIDLLIDETVIVELKSVEKLIPVHEAQVYTYLRLSGKPVGLLLNFNVKMMKDGMKRIVMTR